MLSIGPMHLLLLPGMQTECLHSAGSLYPMKTELLLSVSSKTYDNVVEANFWRLCQKVGTEASVSGLTNDLVGTETISSGTCFRGFLFYQNNDFDTRLVPIKHRFGNPQALRNSTPPKVLHHDVRKLHQHVFHSGNTWL
jgi:hypothetical protein